MPLALTDDQLDIIRNFAEPLRPDQRDAYLQRVAALLGDRELGDGIVSRMAQLAQGEFRRLPAQINGRPHVGKYA
jgi:hypothetical protein